MITASEAISDANLLGSAFVGSSWDTWRALLRAAEGLHLDERQLAAFRSVAGDRDPPRRRVRELWVIGGRRAGKDSIASGITATAAINDYRQNLRPGERATVLCLANTRDQAKIILRYTRQYFSDNPLLQPLVTRWTEEGFELSNGSEVIVSTNSFRAVRGLSLAAVVMDEVGLWRSEESANPDAETYTGILPGLVTLSGMLVGITTAYRKAGLAYDRWRKYFGQDSDDVLVCWGPSTAFNPLLPQAVIDAELERDPEAASAEWLSRWRSDLSDLFDRPLIEAAVEPGAVVRAPQDRFRYAGFADPSGGRGDSFTCAIAH